MFFGISRNQLGRVTNQHFLGVLKGDLLQDLCKTIKHFIGLLVIIGLHVEVADFSRVFVVRFLDIKQLNGRIHLFQPSLARG